MPESKKQKRLRDKAEKTRGVAGKISKKQRAKERMLQEIFDDNETGR